uniref:Small ribosomal subunit protein uS13c n=1 Tax=Aureoumbra lagunensis TaxID=44058 RepID=C6KIV9_9STRA|nr:30S ribosomal protein S13 [Aureoumbra lagunensis]ACS36915.1 30S ribosomal protein S13 [Aureoumbra lagunensis]
MVRIAGVDLPNSKRVEYALTSIYGIGLTSSRSILAAANIDPNKRMHTLEDQELSVLRAVIEDNYKVEDDLRRLIKQNIVRLSQINCVRGRRHRASLPVRGQRTRTNSRTRRKTRLL